MHKSISTCSGKREGKRMSLWVRVWKRNCEYFISIRKLTASNIRYATDKIKKENGTFFMDFIQFPAWFVHEICMGSPIYICVLNICDMFQHIRYFHFNFSMSLWKFYVKPNRDTIDTHINTYRLYCFNILYKLYFKCICVQSWQIKNLRHKHHLATLT